jgi:hypothetical protein
MIKMAFSLLLAFGITALWAGTETNSRTARMLEQYFVIQKELAADSIQHVPEASGKLMKLARSLAAQDAKRKTDLSAMAETAANLKTADLRSARNAFGELSKPMISYVNSLSLQQRPYQFYCPMVKQSWLQPDQETRNPYYGKSMLECGTLVEQFP